MKYRYQDDFAMNYREIPAAFFVHHILEAGSVCDEDGNHIFTGRHNHAEFEILLFLKGSGFAKVGLDERVIPINEGDIVIFNPFEVHTGCYWANTPEQHHLCIDFQASLLEQPLATITQRLCNDLLSQTVRSETVITPKDPIYNGLRTAFMGMFDAINAQKQNEFQFLSHMFAFFNLLHDANRIHKTHNEVLHNTDTDFVKNVLQYINEHFAENVSTRDIASALVYSKEHFCRLFKANFSTSFTDYLTQYRIRKAKSLLASYSSSQVAEMCGFSSQSNFSKVFREAEGISPSEYRKMLLSEKF